MNRIPRILSLPVPSVLSRPRLRRGLLLPALLLVLAACSGDDEPAFTLPPQEDLQEVTLYLSLPALSDSAAKRLGDPGTAQEETDDWNTLVLFIVYESSEVTTQKVRIETLTDEEYGDLQPVSEGSSVKRYTLTAPAGVVYFYGLTYHAPEANENLPRAAALENAIELCSTKDEVEGLTISNYYPYGEGSSSTDVAKFCSVASGYYIGNDASTNWRKAQPKTYTIDYSHISADPQQIPTLTLRRLAAKIDIQWDAEAAYSGGQYTNAYVTGFTYHGSAEGKVFPEINGNGSTSAATDWAFYNRSEISWRNGRTYHYTFPDGTTKPQVKFSIATATGGGTLDKSKEYTLRWNTALERATWYKVNMTVKGNTSQGNIDITGWDDGTGN